MIDQVAPESTSLHATPASWPSKIFRYGLLGLIAFLAMAFGGVEPVGHLTLIIGAAVLALVLAVRFWLRPNEGVIWSWTYVPLFAFVALVGLQSLPISRDLLASIAPPNFGTWTELLGDPASPAYATRDLTISLYPYETRVDFRLLIAGAVIFFGVVNVYRGRREVRNLLVGTSIIGATVLALSALQHLTDSNHLMWTWEMPGHARCGPFLHYGHFSQFVNLSIGGAIALLLMRIVGAGRLDPARARQWFRDLRYSDRRMDLFLFALLVVGPALIIISLSRNGVISMCVAGFVVGLVMHRTRLVPGSGWPLVGFATLALLLVLLIGFDPILDRFSEETPDDAYAGRLALLTDSLRGWLEFPVLGIGQGAFRVVFPMFDTSLRSGTAGHAENQYVEILLETGIVGFGILALFLILVGGAWWRGLRRQESQRRTASIGLAFGVVAVLFHTLTDFGIRIPAVGLLLTVFVGVIVGVAARPAAIGFVSRSLATILCLGASYLLLASVPDTYDTYRANQHWLAMKSMENKLAPVGYKAEKAELDDLLEQASAAVGWQPNNIFHRFWFLQHTWNRATAGRSFEQVKKGPESTRLAKILQSELFKARHVAPTHGPLWSVAGQLGVRFLDNPDAARYIMRGERLSPHDPGTCLAAGWQHLREGDEKKALASLKRAVALSNNPKLVIPDLLDDWDRIDLARRVLAPDPEHLLGLWFAAKAKYPDTEAPVITPGTGVPVEASSRRRPNEIAAIRKDAIDRIEKRIEDNTAEPWMYAAAGTYYFDTGNDEQAIRYLRRHLRLRPKGNKARLALVKALYRSGDRGGALDEVQMLLRRMPKLAEGLSLRRKIMEGK